MSTYSLPPELLIVIIDHVATPSHDLAYVLPPANRKALCALCLVSNTCRTLALPHLYQRIYVQTASQIPLLLQSSAYLRKHTRTLAVGPLSFEPEIAQYVCDLLAAVSGSLERLLISCWGGQTEAERSALAECSGLQEFILPREHHYWGLYTPSDQGLHMTLPSSWMGIRRLSLYRIHLDDFLLALSHFPHLESLCLSDCWLPIGDIPPAFTRFVTELVGLKQIFFMVYTEEASTARDLVRTLRQLTGDKADMVFGLRVVNLIEERFKGGIPGVLTELATAGRLWDPEIWLIDEKDGSRI